jgi:hypothetical protein
MRRRRRRKKRRGKECTETRSNLERRKGKTTIKQIYRFLVPCAQGQQSTYTQIKEGSSCLPSSDFYPGPNRTQCSCTIYDYFW